MRMKNTLLLFMTLYVCVQEAVMDAFFEQETRRVVFSAERAAVRAAERRDASAEAADKPKVCCNCITCVCAASTVLPYCHRRTQQQYSWRPGKTKPDRSTNSICSLKTNCSLSSEWLSLYHKKINGSHTHNTQSSSVSLIIQK